MTGHPFFKKLRLFGTEMFVKINGKNVVKDDMGNRNALNQQFYHFCCALKHAIIHATNSEEQTWFLAPPLPEFGKLNSGLQKP